MSVEQTLTSAGLCVRLKVQPLGCTKAKVSLGLLGLLTCWRKKISIMAKIIKHTAMKQNG